MSVLSMKLHPIYAGFSIFLPFELGCSAFIFSLVFLTVWALCSQKPKYPNTQIPRPCTVFWHFVIDWRMSLAWLFFHILCSVIGSRDNRPYQGLFFPLALALDQNDHLSFFLVPLMLSCTSSFLHSLEAPTAIFEHGSINATGATTPHGIQHRSTDNLRNSLIIREYIDRI